MYIGADMGGSLCKFSFLCETAFLFGPYSEQMHERVVFLHGQKYHLYYRTFQTFPEMFKMIKEHIVPSGGEIKKVGITGAGSVTHKAEFEEVFRNGELVMLDEFQTNLLGLEFVRQTNMEIKVTHYHSARPGVVDIKVEKTTLKACIKPLLFLSLGSGANFSKYDLNWEK